MLVITTRKKKILTEKYYFISKLYKEIEVIE